MENEGLRILLVEERVGDGRHVERALLEGLREARPRVVVAPAVSMALHLLTSEAYDAVVLRSAERDGGRPALFEEMKARAVEVPVVVLVQQDDPARTSAALEGAAGGAVAVPAPTPESVAAAVRHAVDLHRERLERSRLERALEQSEIRYRRVVETAQEAICLVDAAGRVRYGNQRMAAMLECRQDELAGSLLADWIRSPDGEEVRHLLERCRRGAVPRREVWLVLKGGGLGWGLLSAGAVPGREGAPADLLVTMADVTTLKRTEDELRRVNAHLEASVAALERRGVEAAALLDLDAMVQSCLHVEEALAVIGRALRRLFPVDSGVLCLRRGGARDLDTVLSWEAEPAPEGPAGSDDCWAVRRGRLHVAGDAAEDLVCGHVGDVPASGYLCAPLTAQGEVFCVLHLMAGGPAGAASPEAPGGIQSRRRPAAETAEHIALALANLRSRDRLKSEPLRDPVTGLFNRRFMEEFLEREVRRSVRKGRPIGLLRLELERPPFPGTAARREEGDALLRDVGAFLEARVRSGDVVCRYADGEFVVVMPESPLDAAHRRALQIRDGARALDLARAAAGAGGVGLAAAVAAYPDHGATPGALLTSAGEALREVRLKAGVGVTVARPLRG